MKHDVHQSKKFPGGLPPADVRDEVDVLMDQLAIHVAGARVLYPEDNYAGRLYLCEPCGGVHACAAPEVDLIDDYPCPNCGAPQQPMCEPSIPISNPDDVAGACAARPGPPRPNRAERRAGRRARR